MLGIGLAVGVATVLLTVFVYSFLVNRGVWNPATDETGIVPDAEQDDSSEAGGTTTVRTRQPHLALALSPVYVPLILIATGAILSAFNAANSVTDFLGDPVFALFLGLVIAYVLSQIFNGREKTNSSMEEGFSTTGQILLITGVGGSLGEVISATNLARIISAVSSQRIRPLPSSSASSSRGSSPLFCTSRSVPSLSRRSQLPASSDLSSVSSMSHRSSSVSPSARVLCSRCRSTVISSGCSRR